MPALNIRNISDDVHQGLKALAAQHGRSTEAEVRDILAQAVRAASRPPMGKALAAIWKAVAVTDEEAAIIDSARDRVAAKPMSFDE